MVTRAMTEGMPERVAAGRTYDVQSRLGAGGMGEVFLALDPDGRTVAVKLLHPGSDQAARSRLEREVATMRRVRSPHVAEVLDAGHWGERPFVVTRYVQGRPLDVVVRERGPLGGAELLRLARGLAAALAAIHAAGVVHRDLKPANVMLVDGEPVVIDFGIAYAMATTRVTQTGAVVGTAGYVAPEVLRDERAGPAADIFAWAVTVAFAATGRSPFGSGTVEQVFYRVLNEKPDLAGVPAELLALVEGGLVKDPARRPAAADLTARLGGAGPGGAADPGPTLLATAPAAAPEGPTAFPPVAEPAGHGPDHDARHDDARPAAGSPAGAGAPDTEAAGEGEAGAGEAGAGGVAAAGGLAGARTASTSEAASGRPRSFAARRREERMRRIRARANLPEPRRGVMWWLLLEMVAFGAVMAAVKDYRPLIVLPVVYVTYLAVVVFTARRINAAPGGGGARRGAILWTIVAAVGGPAIAVLLAQLVPATVLLFFLVLLAVLAIVAVVLSG
jgi:hypothetical protein